MVVRIAYIKRVPDHLQTLGKAEGRLRERTVPVARFSPANGAEYLGPVFRGEVQLQDAVVMGIGDEEVAGFRMDGQFSGIGQGALGLWRALDLDFFRCQDSPPFGFVEGCGDVAIQRVPEPFS